MKLVYGNRRNFLKNAPLIGLASGTIVSNLKKTNEKTGFDNLNIIGPKEGFTPQIGTLVSMMNWMRDTILYPVNGMSVKDLDYLHDESSNSIGAMLWHLAATERFYQINTFEGKAWGDWSDEDDKAWSTAMSLGNQGRKKIKGNNLEFYLDKLSSVRENSLKELANRDDEWLLAADENWGWGPTNNYCKWFHVVEHESNHNGQIKFIKSRLHST